MRRIPWECCAECRHFAVGQHYTGRFRGAGCEHSRSTEIFLARLDDDSGRHFVPIAVLERNLDGMEAVKLNVFHWHLSENQGFRVESQKYPKLHELGSDGLYYTQEEIRA